MNNKDGQPIVSTVKSRIYGHGRGWCFSVSDFKDLRSSEAVKKSILRLSNEGVVRRIAPGLYEYPRIHKKLGILPPKIENVIVAIKKRLNIKVQPSGAYAANLMGFSEQVPAKVVFLTNGRSQSINIDGQEIVLKAASGKNMALAESQAGVLLQGLRFIGNKHIDGKLERQLKSILVKVPAGDKKKIIKYAPVWIKDLFFKLEEA